MFTGYPAPHRGVLRHDVALGETKVSDTTSHRLTRRVSVALSSLVPSARKGHHSHQALAPAGEALQPPHRDLLPARSRRTGPPERTRSNGSSVHEALRFSSYQCSLMKLHCQRREVAAFRNDG